MSQQQPYEQFVIPAPGVPSAYAEEVTTFPTFSIPSSAVPILPKDSLLLEEDQKPVPKQRCLHSIFFRLRKKIVGEI